MRETRYDFPPESEMREYDQLSVQAIASFVLCGAPIDPGQPITAPRFFCRALVDSGLALWVGEETVVTERDAKGELARVFKRKIATRHEN